jgi:competence protein ComEC
MPKFFNIFILLILSLSAIALSQWPDEYLHIIACDVGQGDGILITYGAAQIVTDGGPDNKILSCLGRHIPFWDRNIELVISTHPDADHITGLTEVVKRFNVPVMLTNNINSGTQNYGLLQTQVGRKVDRVISPMDVNRLRLGLIYLDIVHPGSKDFAGKQLQVGPGNVREYKLKGETNKYSISYKLSFGKFSGFFTGDLTGEVMDDLAMNDMLQSVNYIKIPHHGSDTGLTENSLKWFEPKVAVISVGKNNPWGLPSNKVLEMLENNNVEILRTDMSRDIEVVTDGKLFWVKKR